MTDRTITTSDSRLGHAQPIPQAAAWLGGLGLIPFVAGAIAVLMVDAGWASAALRYYAAAILSFMGGVQWGLAIAADRSGDQEEQLWRRLSLSVVPALIAWLALLASAPYDLITIAAAFVFLLLVDLQAIKQGWAPAWYARLRITLTTIVLICLVVALAATAL